MISDDDEDMMMASMNLNSLEHSTPNRPSRDRSRIKKLQHGSYSFAGNDSIQRSAFSESILSMNSQDRLEIRSWGLPQSVENAYEKVNLNSKFYYQRDFQN